MPLTAGDQLGPYEILAPIGVGGMGEVFRASDPRLGREIAIKALPDSMAHDPERLARFQREARAVAALNHPHIVTIYSVEEIGGVHFLTMELVEGHSLNRLIPETGQPPGLALEQIVEIGSALADALSAAHEKGIIHRDLKPANLMVSKEGRLKVLDFGLAKDLRPASPTDVTQTLADKTEAGIALGTPSYMSPEQVAGRLLDHRTDIFSLGVVLHEMATGRRPFAGDSTAELISAILRDPPPPVAQLRPDLPSDLGRIIRRCLEKDPARRIQTARDVCNEFRELTRHAAPAVAPAAVPAAQPAPVANSGVIRAEEGFWIAVLPFRHSGANADVAALAEGLSEDVVTGLSRFSYLRVIARSSTSRHDHPSMDARTLGRELGARYVMEGSLRHAGARLRLGVQLIDALTGVHLWAQNYERPFSPEGVFELQDDLVPRIVSTVADQYGVLPRSMGEALRGKSEQQLTPHEAVLCAFSFLTRLTPDEHARVRRILERAIQEAPDHSDCWAMLSMVYRGEYAYGFNQRPDSLGRALTAAQRSVDAGPSNHLAYYAKATTLFFQKEKTGFRAAAERAIALNPMDAATTAMLGLFLAAAGDWDRGCALVASAMEVNPNQPGWLNLADFANAYFKADYQAALQAASKVNLPGYFHAHAARTVALAQLGARQAAQKALQELLALRPNFAAEARDEYIKWYDPEDAEKILDGLRKAGLAIAPTSTAE